MSEIKDKAEKLAEAIAESDEFIEMKAAEEKIDNDQEAAELV
ncbi:MAG: YlbF family regulator, partial [Halanaerobium sp.]